MSSRQLELHSQVGLRPEKVSNFCDVTQISAVKGGHFKRCCATLVLGTRVRRGHCMAQDTTRAILEAYLLCRNLFGQLHLCTLSLIRWAQSLTLKTT